MTAAPSQAGAEPLWPPAADLVLQVQDVSLRLAVSADAPGLFAALDHEAVWQHVKGRPDSPEALGDVIEQAPGQGRWMWTARLRDQIVGTTSFLDVVPGDARLEIGFTSYAPKAWAGVVNPSCKLLLMTWAFEEAGFGRVQLKTDIRNARSQGAIERLGAQREGVLREYQRRQDGTMRDTVMYSVLAGEWPVVRQGLRDRLALGA